MNSFGMHILDSSEEAVFAGIHFKGGGGSSGAVDFPDYMKTMHGDWLTDLDTLIGTVSSPFTGVTAYDPDVDISSMLTAVGNFSAAVAALNATTDWEAAIESAKTKALAILGDTYINDDIATVAAILDADIQDNVLPQFQAGMLTTNSVFTSAFVMGEAKIWAMKTREINKYATGLRVEMNKQRAAFILHGADKIVENLRLSVELEKVVAAMNLDFYKIKLIAKKEEVEFQVDVDEKDARWSFDKYQYGVDMLAGISGGTTGAGQRPSKTQSAIGGAFSGASVGYQVSGGNPYGAVVGGLLGVGGSLL